MHSPEFFTPHNEHIEYKRPHEQQDEPFPSHTFEFTKNNKVVGGAELQYYSKGLPHYEVSELWVDYEESGQGYASQIMDAVEEFLRAKKKPGTLVDAIYGNQAAVGMYERRGWQKVPNARVLIFNWPADVPLTVLSGYAQRYTYASEREGAAIIDELEE